MNDTPYRVGLIGCGRIGTDTDPTGSSRIRCHAESYRACVKTELIAASDPDPSRLKRAGARWRIPRLYADHHSLLQKERLDLISLCSPTQTHAEILHELLMRGECGGVLLEKPVASTLEEACRLATMAKDSSVVVAVNYGRRFCPVYRRLANQVRGGLLGRIQYVHAAYTKGLYNNGTHLIDLLCWFLGEPAEVIGAQAVHLSGDPTVSFQLAWEDGALARVEACDPDSFFLFEVDFVGTTGRLRFTDQGHQVEYYPLQERTGRLAFHQLVAEPQQEGSGFADSIRFAVEDLIASLEEGRDPACTLMDGVRALSWAERIETQAREGCRKLKRE